MFRKLFEIDLRALGAFRVGIGLLLIVDLSLRAFDLTAFYTDFGVLPRSQLRLPMWVDGMFSIHAWGGGVGYQGALFLAAFLLAVSVLIGWQTRWALFLSWVLLISLHNRNILILNGGDHLLRAFILWAMFLPVGRRYSVDALRSEIDEKATHHCSPATFVLLMQMVILYEFAGFSKLHPFWLKDGSAVYYALASEQITKPLGFVLLPFGTLLKALTFGTMVLEIIVPVLAFIPRKTDMIRLVMVPVFWLFHLGLFLTLDLGFFPWACMLGWIPFLPSPFWDWLESTRMMKTCTSRVGSKTASNRSPGTKSRKLTLAFTRAGYAAVLLAFLYVLLWNVKTLKPEYRGVMPTSLLPVGYALRLDQRWQLFSPHPSTDLAWHVFVGTLSDGRQIDLLDGEKLVSWEKPEYIQSIYGGTRWRQYFKLFLTREYSMNRQLYCEYLCRKWKQENESDTLQRIELYYMKTPLYVDQPSPPAERFFLWGQDCK